MVELVATMMTLFSVLLPVKGWYAPGQPLTVQVKAQEVVTLVLTDFAGKGIEAAKPAEVEAGAKEAVDLRSIFPVLNKPGTYILYAVPKGKETKNFVGTPLVIEVRTSARHAGDAEVNIIRVEPLCYALMETEQGAMTLTFYYDVAPNTVDNFLTLAAGKYYDGLSFHRIVPGFVIQGGDPRGDGTGGPGYQIGAEFNDRPHQEGVLSMARASDPNSAGSQFFVCLNYATTQQLDRQYTAFGKVVSGMDVVRKIAATPLADAASGRPATPQVIKQVTVKAVTAVDNPYAAGAGK